MVRNKQPTSAMNKARLIRIWDVFICYAFEDKEDFARPLAEALRSAGVKVWFDDFEIRLGESIAQKIEKGLANSEAGIIILSKSSVNKNWPQYEASAIKQLYLADSMRLIPVLKDLSFQQLRRLNPGLVDLKGIDAKGRSIAECAYRIIETVRPDIHSAIYRSYIKRKLDETAETVSIDPRKIRRGPRRRDKFPERDVLRISVLHACFGELFQDKLVDWLDSFCHDLNYEREIRVWERMTACYLYCISGQNYNQSVRKDIFGLLLGLFSGSTSDELEKGFKSLGPEVGTRLYQVIEDWLNQWKWALNYVIEHELSDDREVQSLLDQHMKSSPRW